MVVRKLFPLLVLLFLAGHYVLGGFQTSPLSWVTLLAGLTSGALGLRTTAGALLCLSAILIGAAVPMGGDAPDAAAEPFHDPDRSGGGIWECLVITTTQRGAMLETSIGTFWAADRDMGVLLRRSDSVTVLGSVNGRWMDVCSFRPRPSDRLQDRLRRGICSIWTDRIASRDASSLTAALVAGERGLLTSRIRELFSRTGTSHLLAVSGLHVSLVAAALIILLRRVAGTGALTATAAVLMISAYVLLTGSRPSTIRAAVMFAVLIMASRRSGRVPDLLSVWAAAVVAVLFATSLDTLEDAGARMSFAAVLSLILVGRRFRGPVGAALSVLFAGVTVTLCLSPLVGSVYGSVSLAAPIATLASMPFMLTVMLLGPLALTWGPLASGAGIVLEWAVFIWLWSLGLMKLPSVPAGSSWLPLWAAAVLLLWLLSRRWRFPVRWGMGIRG